MQTAEPIVADEYQVNRSRALLADRPQGGNTLAAGLVGDAPSPLHPARSRTRLDRLCILPNWCSSRTAAVIPVRGHRAASTVGGRRGDARYRRRTVVPGFNDPPSLLVIVGPAIVWWSAAFAEGFHSKIDLPAIVVDNARQGSAWSRPFGDRFAFADRRPRSPWPKRPARG